MNLTWTAIGFARAIAAINSLPGKAEAELTAAGLGVLQFGVAEVRRNASGRPGPRIVTGNLLGSIRSDWRISGDVFEGQIGTNAVYARRLEFGFVGPDSLGRVYNQPPYPFMNPAVPAIRARLIAASGEAARQVRF